MIIAHNLMALNGFNRLNKNNNSTAKVIEKLSSGLRINRASDDDAGLAISEKMRAQIRGLNQAARNAQDGISLIQTAEGGIASIHESLQRMRELCVQGANDTLNDSDRQSIQMELDQLNDYIRSTSNNTEFNSIKLLDGSHSSQASTVSVTANPNMSIPSDGSTASSNITVDGHVISFEFTKTATDKVDIIVKNGNDVLGTQTVNITTPGANIEWQKSLGGSNGDYAYDVKQTSDGGYIVTGHTWSTDGDLSGTHDNGDLWVVKLDSTGNLQWQKTLGGHMSDLTYSIQQTSDGGYIVAGSSQSIDGDVVGNHGFVDMWVVKLDSAGSLQWQKSLGGSGDDYSNSIQQTSDGGYIVAGSSQSNDGDVSGNHGSSDMWVTKLDSTGNLQWQKSLGGSSPDYAYSIQQTSDGGYIVAGRATSNDGDVSGNHGLDDMWVVKLDSTGNLQWQKSIGGTSSDDAYSIRQTSDGGYIVAGTTSSNNGDVSGIHGAVDMWVVKLDSSGDLQWQKCLGGSSLEHGFSIELTGDGGYIVAGESMSNDGDVSGNHGNSDFWIVKLDSGGTIQWQDSLGGSSAELAYGAQQTSDGGYVAAGYSLSNNADVSGNHGSYDMWITKFSTLSNNVVTALNLNDIIDSSGIVDFTGATVTFNPSVDTVIDISVSTYRPSNGINLQVGANAGQTMTIPIDDMRPEALGLMNGIPRVIPKSDAQLSISILDGSIQYASSARSSLGAKHNALEHIIANVSNAAENLTAAESRIRDMDMAKGVMDMVKNNILVQASQAMLAQANQAPQGVLQLLK